MSAFVVSVVGSEEEAVTEPLEVGVAQDGEGDDAAHTFPRVSPPLSPPRPETSCWLVTQVATREPSSGGAAVVATGTRPALAGRREPALPVTAVAKLLGPSPTAEADEWVVVDDDDATATVDTTGSGCLLWLHTE